MIFVAVKVIAAAPGLAAINGYKEQEMRIFAKLLEAIFLQKLK